MNKKFSVKQYFDSHAELGSNINLIAFEKGINMVKDTFINGKKILTCGNGGSASTASHFITDWNKMVNLATSKKFRGISLCDNIGLITAYGNDLSYDDVFSGQSACCSPGNSRIHISSITTNGGWSECCAK